MLLKKSCLRKMLNLIFLAVSISMVVSTGKILVTAHNECDGKEENFRFHQRCNECWCRSGKPVCTNKGCGGHEQMLGGINECVDKKDNFQFFQGCNECWCVDGKATCTNKGCTFVNDEDNEYTEDEQVRKENAIGIHAWDLENKFPEKDGKLGTRKRASVTPYPPSFHRRFNLQQPLLEKGLQRYPPSLAYNHPDPGGLNVLNDAVVIQQQQQQQQQQQYPQNGQYQQYPQYSGYPQYQVYSNYPVIPNGNSLPREQDGAARPKRKHHKNAAMVDHRQKKKKRVNK